MIEDRPALHEPGMGPDRDRFSPEEHAAVDAITRELRENGWVPRRPYLCGCDYRWICPVHSEVRATDHYRYVTP